jgi:hypothetical protein
MTVLRVPTAWMSSGTGSSVRARRWADSRISFWLPGAVASSSAPIDFSRPTNSGTTMWGNTTVSRSGSSGTRRARLASSDASSVIV